MFLGDDYNYQMIMQYNIATLKKKKKKKKSTLWLYVITISRTSFRVNPHSIVCLNVKELLARNRSHIWSLSDSNEIWTHNHLVRKGTLDHIAKVAKWLSCVVSTYLDGAFDFICFWLYASHWYHNISVYKFNHKKTIIDQRKKSISLCE